MRLVSDMVKIGSVSRHERKMARYVARKLRELGMHVQLQHVEADCFNVVGTMKGRGGPAVMLGGHLDTVPASPQWSREPRELMIECERAYGLGAGDMKGGLAAQIAVLRKLARNGTAPSRDIVFVALGDEEGFSTGANYFAEACRDIRAEFCIFAEPHFDEIVVGASGKGLLKLTVSGSGGHASRPESGVSAIECMTRFLAVVDERYRRSYLQGATGSHCSLKIESRYPGYSLSIPEECSVLMNKQLALNENMDSFVDDLQRIYRETCGENGVLAIERLAPRYAAYRLDEEYPPLLRLKAEAEKRRGRTVGLAINQSVSDGNILTHELGIPTVLFGPRGVDFHKPDEYLDLTTVDPYIDILSAYLQT